MIKDRPRTDKGTFVGDPRREEARALGDKTYQGYDCKYNHGGIRFVSNHGCAECLKLDAKKYYAKNKDRMQKKNRDYAKADPAANSARTQKWNKDNPQYMKMIKHKRRELISSADVKMLTVKEWKEIKSKYDHTCLCCGKKEPDIKLEMDHVVSIKNGGFHTYQNIQPLCRRCNAIKNSNDTDYRSFYEDMGGFWNTRIFGERGAGSGNDLSEVQPS